jgi:hypothetical protein
MQDDSAVTALRAFKQENAPENAQKPGFYSFSSSESRTFRAGTTVEMACL